MFLKIFSIKFEYITKNEYIYTFLKRVRLFLNIYKINMEHPGIKIIT